MKGRGRTRTNLAHNFVVLQNAPGDVDAVIVPVGPRHGLVDICIDATHLCDDEVTMC